MADQTNQSYTDLQPINKTETDGDDTTAIPGVLVDNENRPYKKISIKTKAALFIVFAIIVALVVGLSYYFGRRTPTTSPPVTVEIVENPRDFAWIEVGNGINGSMLRDFLGASVDISDDGKAIASLARSEKGFYEEIDETWITRDTICAFCKDSYGDQFVAENVTRESESSFGVVMSSDGNQCLFGTSYLDFGVGFVRKYDEVTKTFERFGEPIYGATHADEFGASPAMSSDGTILAIGALEGRYVNIYEKVEDGNNTEWKLSFTFKDPKLGFARTQFMAMSGDGSRIAIAIALEGVKVIERQSSGTWEQIGQLITSNKTGELFGSSTGLSHTGHRMVVSDPRMENENGEVTGGIQVYSFDPESEKWSQLGKTLSGNNIGDYFGYSVSISGDGNRIAAGAVGDTSLFIWDYVKIYDYINDEWTQIGEQLTGKQFSDWFGYSIAFTRDGKRIVVGSPLYSIFEPQDFRGKISVFELKKNSTSIDT